VRQFGIEGNGTNGNQQQTNGIGHNPQTAGPEQTLEGEPCRHLLVVVLVQFQIVAFNQRNTVRHGTSRDQEGYYQTQRVQVVAEQ